MATDSYANFRDGCDTPALQLARLRKVQICREQRSANEARRSGGEYPRASTVFCKREIAIMNAATGRLPIESKCCASFAWLVARSGAAGALQQLRLFTGVLLVQFASQHEVAEHPIADGAPMLSGSIRATRIMARKRTTTTVAGPFSTRNLRRPSNCANCRKYLTNEGGSVRAHRSQIPDRLSWRALAGASLCALARVKLGLRLFSLGGVTGIL